MFANFWSCWALLNIYVTMVHQEDGLHRMFYGLYTMMAFVMCISTEHPDHSFFDYPTQAFFHALVSICTRLMIVVMYGIYLYQDGRMRADPSISAHLPKYSRKQVKRQVAVQAGSIMVACIFFMVTCITEYTKIESDETRRLAGDDGCSDTSRRLGTSQWWPRKLAGSDDSGCSEEVKPADHYVTIALWLIAVFIEQFGNIYSIIYDSLPFSGEYAGERMQAWLMLCFGESVIGLLINPSYFDSVSLKSILASFVMVFCLVTVYFDVTDADKFLHLFILRKEKLKAFCYCFCHWPFSMFVFFLGVALKTINYIELGIHDLEVSSGCGHLQFETLRRERRKLWEEGGALDQLKDKLGDSYESLVGNALGDGLSLVDGSGLFTENHGRRLAAWTLDEYDDLIQKCFIMLCFGVALVQICSVLVAYAMPTDQNMIKVHLSRFGSVGVVLFCIFIPFNLQSVKTDCLAYYEETHRRRLDIRSAATTSYANTQYAGENWNHDKHMKGLTVVEALITTALIVVVSFIVSMFSIDVERAHTYKELEDAAHHGREPEMTHQQSLAAKGGVAFLAKAMTAKAKTGISLTDIHALKSATDDGRVPSEARKSGEVRKSREVRKSGAH